MKPPSEIIKQNCLEHPINQFFVWLQTNKNNYPIENIIFENLKYFYQNGYKQFEIEEWGKKFKIDYRDKNNTKGHGALIQALYNLCKECHALQDASGVEISFSNAYRWFAYSLLELIWCDLHELSFDESKGRKDVEMWKQRLKQLTDISGDADLYNTFHHETKALPLLIESAYILSEQNPSFNEKYWKPFLTAQKNIIKTLENNNTNLVRVRLLPKTLEFESKPQKHNGRYKKPKPIKYK